MADSAAVTETKAVSSMPASKRWRKESRDATPFMKASP